MIPFHSRTLCLGNSPAFQGGRLRGRLDARLPIVYGICRSDTNSGCQEKYWPCASSPFRVLLNNFPGEVRNFGEKLNNGFYSFDNAWRFFWESGRLHQLDSKNHRAPGGFQFWCLLTSQYEFLTVEEFMLLSLALDSF